MTVKNQVLNLKGEKMNRLVLVDNAIRLSRQSDSDAADSNKNWSQWLTLKTKTDIPFDTIQNITQVVGADVVTIRYQTSLGGNAVQQITFQKPGDLQAFYQFFQKEKGFVKKEQKVSSLESTMSYWIPMGIILLLTAFAYTESMRITSGEYIPPENLSKSTQTFQLLLEIVGSGGIVCIGFALATYCVYKGWKHYFNPPVLNILEVVKKKK
jgi:sporulation protein YlmC with PRC-barrel domain